MEVKVVVVVFVVVVFLVVGVVVGYWWCSREGVEKAYIRLTSLK